MGSLIRPFRMVQPPRHLAHLVASRSYLSYNKKSLKDKFEHNSYSYLQVINPDATEKQILLISRGLVLVLGIIAFLLVSQFKTVLNAAFTAYNIYGTSITPALLAAFLWKRATKEGAIASIITGATVTIVWTYFLPSWEGFSTLNPFLQELTYPAAGLSVSALVIGSLLTSAPPPESLEQFFNDGD